LWKWIGFLRDEKWKSERIDILEKNEENLVRRRRRRR